MKQQKTVESRVLEILKEYLRPNQSEMKWQ